MYWVHLTRGLAAVNSVMNLAAFESAGTFSSGLVTRHVSLSRGVVMQGISYFIELSSPRRQKSPFALH